MEQSEKSSFAPPPHVIGSLVAVIVGSLLLRLSNSIMSENIQFYFNAIHEAALSPTHPLRLIVGEQNVHEISDTVGGFIISMFYITEVIGAMVLGAWSDRFGRKVFIIMGPLLGAAAVLITSVTTSLWVLGFTRLLEGLSTGSNAPATLGYVAETTAHSPTLRTRVSGLFEVANILGIAIGFVLGGMVWRWFGAPAVVMGIVLTSPAFALTAIVYFVCLAVLWFGIKEVKEKRTESLKALLSPIETIKHYWMLARNPLIIGFAPAWIAINAVLGIWFNTTARILTDKSGDITGQLLVGQFDSETAGWVRGGYALFFILGIAAWSIFFPKLKRSTAMLIGCAGLGASCILIALLNHQTDIHAPLTTVLAVLLVVSIMVQSSFTPAALAYLADISETQRQDRGAIMGLYSIFFGLGQAMGTALSGPFIDRSGMDGMALATGLLGVFAAFLVLRLRSVNLPVVSGTH